MKAALRGARAAFPSRRRTGAALALGALAALGQAPLGWWFVAFPALAGIVWLVTRADGRGTAGWTGFLAGFGYFGTVLHWIVFPFFVDPWRHGWMAPFALVLFAAGLALFWAVAAWVGRPGMGRGRRAMLFALLWGLAEVLRGHVLTGFPWAQPGHVWADSLLAQFYALLGANGVTVVTLLAAAAPVAMGRRAIVVLVPVALLAAGWSAHRLALPEPAPRDAAVRLVQPNAEQHLKWAPDWAERHFLRLLELTAAPLPPDGVDLVIWPETSVPYLVTEGEGIALDIASAAGGAPVAAGIQRVEGARGWNTLAVFGAGGRISAHYDKHHLVPFGEYVPFGDLLYDWIGLRAFAAQVGAGYTAGEGPRVLDLGPRLGRVLPLICYEVVFPQLIARAPERADWMVQITNDAWFGPWAGPAQHFAQARIRAIEQGLPLIRVANSGVSAVIDARGRLAGALDGALARLDLGAAGRIDAVIPGALPATPYARWGDLGAALLLLGGLGLWVLRGRGTKPA